MKTANKYSEEELIAIIAKAIKAADNSYFFENYSRQAKNVLMQLRKQGWTITPPEATPEMIKAGVKAIGLGIIDARELAKTVFQEMQKAYKD